MDFIQKWLSIIGVIGTILFFSVQYLHDHDQPSDKDIEKSVARKLDKVVSNYQNKANNIPPKVKIDVSDSSCVTYQVGYYGNVDYLCGFKVLIDIEGYEPVNRDYSLHFKKVGNEWIDTETLEEKSIK